MPDSNTLFLKTAAAVMNELDVQYMEADLDGKIQLKDDLDRAMQAYSQVRRQILANEVRCSATDVSKMQTLQQEIQRSPDIQTVLQVLTRIISLLTGLRGF